MDVNKSKLIKALQRYYTKIHYDQKFAWDKIVLKYMRSCDKILDIGCGVGRFISHDFRRITGLDQNFESLEICKQKGFNVKYGEATNLPFEDAFFDGVHCSHVIEHLLPIDAHKLLSEMDRVLKKGGVLCIRTPLLYSDFYSDFTHIKPYHPKAILHYLKSYNLQQEVFRHQSTLSDIPGLYKVIKLRYERARLFQGLMHTPLWVISPLFNILYRFKITSLKKKGYMLILKKIG